MYSPPTNLADEHRILAAQTTAAQALGVTVNGPRRWGYGGRTLGQQAHHPRYGECWMQLISAPTAKAHGKLWDGTRHAAAAFPNVHRPALHGIYDLTREDTAYRAELFELITSPICSPDPVLRTELNLSSLRHGGRAATPTDRIAVRQAWIDRAVPQHTGLPPSGLSCAVCQKAQLFHPGPYVRMPRSVSGHGPWQERRESGCTVTVRAKRMLWAAEP